MNGTSVAQNRPMRWIPPIATVAVTTATAQTAECEYSVAIARATWNDA